MEIIEIKTQKTKIKSSLVYQGKIIAIGLPLIRNTEPEIHEDRDTSELYLKVGCKRITFSNIEQLYKELVEKNVKKIKFIVGAKSKATKANKNTLMLLEESPSFFIYKDPINEHIGVLSKEKYKIITDNPPSKINIVKGKAVFNGFSTGLTEDQFIKILTEVYNGFKKAKGL